MHTWQSNRSKYAVELAKNFVQEETDTVKRRRRSGLVTRPLLLVSHVSTIFAAFTFSLPLTSLMKPTISAGSITPELSRSNKLNNFFASCSVKSAAD